MDAPNRPFLKEFWIGRGGSWSIADAPNRPFLMGLGQSFRGFGQGFDRSWMWFAAGFGQGLAQSCCPTGDTGVLQKMS